MPVARPLPLLSCVAVPIAAALSLSVAAAASAPVARAQQPAARPAVRAPAPAAPQPERPAAAAVPQPYVEELPGMGRPIDVAATAARRERLMERLGDAVVVIPASRGRNAETDYVQDNDFRQSNTFFYFTQLEQPRAFLVMSARAAGPDTVVLLLPDRNPQAERWIGRGLGAGESAARLTGVPIVLSVTKLDSVLGAVRGRGVPVYVPQDRYSQGVQVLDLLRADSGVVVRNLRPTVDSLRVAKDAAEIAALRRAIEITGEALREVLRTMEPGTFEYQIEAVIEGTFRRLGADRVGFPSIVASGVNGTVMHYDVNRRRTDPGDLVVMDIGAEYGQHTADVTRTYPVSGRFTPRQRQIYDLVLAVNQVVIDSVRPGMTLPGLNQIAFAYLRANSGSLCGAPPATCAPYMIHGVSHYIGMDVHDVGPAYAPLVPGAVFTVEPGIYLPDEGFGIRIEDDVLVTPTGHEVLSAGAPKAVAEIERMMQRPAAAPRRSGRGG